MAITPAEVAADHAGLLFGRGRVQRPELVQADDDRGVTGTGPPLGRRRSQTARAPGSSWPRRSGRSRSSALYTHRTDPPSWPSSRPSPWWLITGDHPLGDQVLG